MVGSIISKAILTRDKLKIVNLMATARLLMMMEVVMKAIFRMARGMAMELACHPVEMLVLLDSIEMERNMERFRLDLKGN